MTREEAMESIMTREEAMESIMTREEAIEVIKRNCRLDSDLRKACELFIPELTETKQEWSEEDKLHYANVLEALEYVKGCKSDYDKIEAVKSDIVWFKALRPQPKEEWSEVDEEMIGNIISSLRGYIHYVRENGNYNNHEAYIQKEIEFLNSLRPQPKQDVFPSLSEKGIICLKRALDHLRKEHNRYGGEDFTNEIAVLEWLITHPILVSDTHWKPSEEQMKILNWAANGMVDKSAGAPEMRAVLRELYEQLKKLM